jgi:hypothetical protein
VLAGRKKQQIAIESPTMRGPRSAGHRQEVAGAPERVNLEPGWQCKVVQCQPPSSDGDQAIEFSSASNLVKTSSRTDIHRLKSPRRYVKFSKVSFLTYGLSIHFPLFRAKYGV